MTYARGETSGKSVLTDKEVIEIRTKYIPWKYSYTKLSLEYFVNRKTISNIITRKTWRHL